MSDSRALNRKLWLAGHVLSLMGLIDEACQMRDLSWHWSENELKAYEQASILLSGIDSTDSDRRAMVMSVRRHMRICG